MTTLDKTTNTKQDAIRRHIRVYRIGPGNAVKHTTTLAVCTNGKDSDKLAYSVFSDWVQKNHDGNEGDFLWMWR